MLATECEGNRTRLVGRTVVDDEPLPRLDDLCGEGSRKAVQIRSLVVCRRNRDVGKAAGPKAMVGLGDNLWTYVPRACVSLTRSVRPNPRHHETRPERP